MILDHDAPPHPQIGLQPLSHDTAHSSQPKIQSQANAEPIRAAATPMHSGVPGA